MFTLKIKNANGETFELTHNSENYLITDIQWLTRPQAAINTSTGGALDGTFFNSSRVEQRNLVITVELHGDIEANRQQLYSICSINKPCTIFSKTKTETCRSSAMSNIPISCSWKNPCFSTPMSASFPAAFPA